MEPLIQYVLAAVLLVLGLAVVGGALFGRKRKQRLLLVRSRVYRTRFSIRP